MDRDYVVASSRLVASYLSTQPFSKNQLALVQRTLDSLSNFGKDLEKAALHQTDWLRSMSLSLDYASQMSQYISQSIDTTVLARQITDIVRRQNFQLAADDLVKAMDISFPEHLFHVSSPFPSSEVIDRCVAALEKATPYMPDDVNREIQDTVIAPAKKKQLSVDTLLSILALVLTILIFVFEQVTGHIAQLEDEKALDALCESNQQLAGEIDELSRTIQQLTDEVGELSNCVNRLSEVTLDEKEPDREESEADSLEQVDNSQQSEPAL